MVSMPPVSYADWLSPVMPSALSSRHRRRSRVRRQTPAARRAPRRPSARQHAGRAPLLRSGQIVESPETGFRYADRSAARRRRLRPGLPRPAARAVAATFPRSSASRSARASTAGCARRTSGSCSTIIPRAIRVYDAFPLLARGAQRPLLPRARVRALRRSQRVSAPATAAAGRSGPRGARSPASSKCSASCIAASCCIAI